MFWVYSSIGWSVRFTSERLEVQVLLDPPRLHLPAGRQVGDVGGSSPSTATMNFYIDLRTDPFVRVTATLCENCGPECPVVRLHNNLAGVKHLGEARKAVVRESGVEIMRREKRSIGAHCIHGQGGIIVDRSKFEENPELVEIARRTTGYSW